MKVLFTSSALVVSLVGCAASSTDSIDFLLGTWHTPPVPSGGAVVLTLRSSGDSVSGEDHEFGIMGAPADSGTVSGHYADGVYTLRVVHAGGGIATYAGRLVGSDTLDGTWTPAAPHTAYSLRFFRQSD
jgi:hypothetical protein